MNDKNTPTTEPKVITIDTWKAIVIVVTAMLGSAGAGLWGGVVTLNSDHYTVVAMAKEINEIRAGYMPLDLSQEKWKNNDFQHGEIIRRLDVIQTTLGRLK